MKIFVYGTLRKGYWNNAVFMKGSTFLGKGKTGAKYHLYAEGIPFVAKVGKHPTQIVGELYEVSRFRMPRIDWLEGHPKWYRRERVRVTLEDGKKVRAWIYFNETPRGREIPSGDYADVRPIRA